MEKFFIQLLYTIYFLATTFFMLYTMYIIMNWGNTYLNFFESFLSMYIFAGLFKSTDECLEEKDKPF